jgi:hypothetical protein
LGSAGGGAFCAIAALERLTRAAANKKEAVPEGFLAVCMEGILSPDEFW